jgi:hypothetical protein
MKTALIMLGATVAYFAVMIPVAILIGKWIQRGRK